MRVLCVIHVTVGLERIFSFIDSESAQTTLARFFKTPERAGNELDETVVR